MSASNWDSPDSATPRPRDPATSGNEWHSRFWSNAASGYAAVAVRLVAGLLVFRLLWQHLPEAAFGFWGSLWAVLGFAILLDLGLGATLQRAVVRFHANGDLAALNRLLATAFFSAVLLAGTALGAALLLTAPLLSAVHVPIELRPAAAAAWRDFCICLAIGLPLGLFTEVLRGLHRTALINRLGMTNNVLVLGAVWLGCRQGLGLEGLTAVVASLSLLPALQAWWHATRLVPGLSVAPRFLDLATLKREWGFSAAAWMIALCNVVLAGGELLLVASLAGVAAVPAYAAGARVADLLRQLIGQLHAPLPPAAGELHAKGDAHGLALTLRGASRLTVLVTTPALVLGLVYTEPLVRVFTGSHAPAASVPVAQVLLIAAWIGAVGGGAARRMLVLCGRERQIMALLLVHTAISVALAILLGHWLGPVGVALATLSVNALVATAPSWVMQVRMAGRGWWWFTAPHVTDLVMSLALTGLGALAVGWLWPVTAQTGMLGVLARGALAALPLIVLLRRVRGVMGQPVAGSDCLGQPVAGSRGRGVAKSDGHHG